MLVFLVEEYVGANLYSKIFSDGVVPGLLDDAALVLAVGTEEGFGEEFFSFATGVTDGAFDLKTGADSLNKLLIESPPTSVCWIGVADGAFALAAGAGAAFCADGAFAFAACAGAGVVDRAFALAAGDGAAF
jgi:hypothetical protein